MKLNQLKNLGKELSKKELINVNGGDVVVGYMCNNGALGTMRGRNGHEDWEARIKENCGSVGGKQTFVRFTHADDAVDGRYLN